MTNQDDAERIRLDEIQKRAYAIYQARGGMHGMDLDDWLQAEREVDGLDEGDALTPVAEEDERPPAA